MSNGVISNILCNVSGKELIISNNILDVATAVDIAQFEHVTVRCNRKLVSTRSLAPTEENCPKTLNVPLMPKFTTFPGISSYEEEVIEEPSSAALGNFHCIQVFSELSWMPRKYLQNTIRLFFFIIHIGNIGAR